MTREQFIKLVNDEQEALRGFLLALCCGNKDDADDIAQEALVKAYLASVGYQDKGRFRSWLFKIAQNTFLNHKVAQRTFESIDEARAFLDTSDMDAKYARQELYLALATLPPKERAAIVLFYLDGHSIRDISKITDTSEEAVKKQLSRGRDKLKTRLKL
ncbi:MAG: RNA polymerase sigma factor [Bacteroidaceae bacterium]|nr:RNA polymerase sigma factor [Bacteroidaceae bacterium]